MAEENVTPNQQGEQNNEDQPASFEAILEKDPKIKELYEQHTAALLNTVKATREERDGLKNQVKDLLAKSEKGSDNEKALTETLAKLEATERRATFVEEAVKPGIDCRNPKAAYAYAVTVDAFDKRGNPDWALLKREAPELFGKSSPAAHGGSGTETLLQANDFNSMIRRAAGR
jgi:hypothetical protein